MSGSQRSQSRFKRRRSRIHLSPYFEPGTRIFTAIFVLTWVGFAGFMFLVSGKGTQLAHWITSPAQVRSMSYAAED
jgi:hypothetical protein